MRPVPSCALLLAAIASVAPGAVRPLTIVMDFQGPHSPAAVAAMQRELRDIMGDTGLRLDFRSPDQAAEDSFANLVVVRFKGSCVLAPVGFLYDERGPLAFTYSSGGAVIPFSEVDCDKVAASARSAMWGDDFRNADALLGRALGRVLAHELVHMLTRSPEHGRTGVAEPALSGKQLISERLRLSAGDIERLHGR